jgi:nicotinamide riboside transporter PnuC
MDLFAAAFALAGVWLISEKNRWGFLLCLCSGILWLGIAAKTHLIGLYLEVLPLMILNVRGFLKWRESLS